MNKISVLAFFLCTCLSSVAQDRDLLDKLCTDLSGSCVEISYSYVVRVSGVNISGRGTLSAQDRFWHLEGNGVEMFCDARTLWVVDPAAKEVVVEPADGQGDGYMTNPAMIFIRLDELFTVRESRNTDGGKTVLYMLSPKQKGTVDYFNIEVNVSDATIKGGTIAMSDGNLIKIEVSSMKLTPVRSVEDFRPHTVFDSSWILTDLR